MMLLRLAHVSDIHFGCENTAAVAATRAWLEQERPHALLVTGDITQSGRRREFEAARAWLGSITALKICTPGNHDTPYWDLLARLAWPFQRYAGYIGPGTFEAVSAPGLAVAAMNTARGAQPRANWSKGQARRGDAIRLCEALGRSPGTLRVAICHHPLMEVTGGPMTGRVWGGEEASRVLAEGGADLVLTGHVHMPFAHALPFGDHRTYNVGASTLSMRERGSPAGFNLIEADERQIRVTALGWTGSGFEPQRSWGFDRRAEDATLARSVPATAQP
jgi:3',5'-cyclic AMP phosphodiesterase CpdA